MYVSPLHTHACVSLHKEAYIYIERERDIHV